MLSEVQPSTVSQLRSAPDKSQPVGVAVIGCGAIAADHFQAWRRLADAGKARLAAACDSDLGRAQAAVERYGAASAAADFYEVVGRPDVHAVDICLPHHLHLPTILAAAEMGKHVLCEKPLALTVREAVEAVRACRQAGVVLMTANRDRFEPHARVVKRIIDLGLLGKPNMLLERHLLHKDVLRQASDNHMEWKLMKAASGGGVLHREGCYYLDTLMYWDGSGVAHVAGAEFDNFLWDTAEVETTSHVLFRFRSGAIGVFEMAWCLQGPHLREVTINGSEGHLRLSGAVRGDATITVYSRRLNQAIMDDPGVIRSFEECFFQAPETVHPDRSSEALVLRVPYAAGFHALGVEFLSAIQVGREPESNGLDGARALEVVEAAYRSAQERRAIDLPLVNWSTLH